MSFSLQKPRNFLRFVEAIYGGEVAGRAVGIVAAAITGLLKPRFWTGIRW
jgi:hypothetical protein